MAALLVTSAGCGSASAPRSGDDTHEVRPAAPTAAAPVTPAVAPAPEPAAPAAPAAPADGRYEGRTIAPTCSYQGSDWLDRADRDAKQQPERVLDALKLDPHSAVADVGAGTGYFTVRLARRVAKVHATDVQPEMLRKLADRLAREKLNNVELHQATGHDAALPAHCCDLVLLVDVYHELADPPGVMAGIRRALTEHGRLVLIEYRADDPKVQINPEHKMTLPQIKSEVSPLGFHFVESLEFLPEQRIVIFDAGS
jgi:ubiquinone/menaquinone biosynthesis C-methylase UbiE